MRQLKYLVTGTGRCGTVYLSRLLTSLGTPCGHESIFGVYGLMFALRRLAVLDPCYNSLSSSRDGEQGRIIDLPDAEASYMAAPYLASGLFHNCDKVIHLVRNPLEVVNSFVNGLRYFASQNTIWENDKGEFVSCGYHRFIYQYVPELTATMTPIERACLYYVRWNQMIEKFLPPNGVRVRLEDCPQAIFSALGTEPPHIYYEVTNSNTADKKGKTTSLLDIPDGKIKLEFVSIAERYGYKLRKVFA